MKRITTTLSLSRSLPTLALILLIIASPASSAMAQVSMFLGEWTGTWADEFGNGTISMDVSADGNDVQALVTLTGVIFGNPGPHAAFAMTGTFNPGPAGEVSGMPGITFTDPDNPIYGPLTITIDLDGSATANAPSIPSNGPGVTSGTGTGQLNSNSLTATGRGVPVPDFGGSAITDAMIALTSPATPAAEQSLFFPQVGEGTTGPGPAGGGQQIDFNMEFAIENTNSTAAAVSLDFFSTPDGAPMVVNLMEQGTASSFSFNLAAGETLFLRTPGTTQPIQVGYARLNSPRGVSGVGIFTRADAGTKVTKAGILASEATTSFSIPIDNRGANDLGLALAVPPGGSVVAGASNVTIRLYDENFQLLGTRNLAMLQGSHMAAFLSQPALFGSVTGINELTGSITVDASNNGVAVAVLLQDDDPAVLFPSEVPILTAFPVIEGRADNAASAPPDSAIQEVEMRFNIPALEKQVGGAIYRLYRGEIELAKYLRSVRGPGETVERFSLPRGIDLKGISATIQYIYRDGSEGSESARQQAEIVGR